MDIYISVKIIIGTVIKNPEMLTFVPDHKKSVNMQFQKLSCLLDYYLLSIISWSYLLIYVTDKYKTQQMCDEDILKNGGALKYVSDS